MHTSVTVLLQGLCLPLAHAFSKKKVPHILHSLAVAACVLGTLPGCKPRDFNASVSGGLSTRKPQRGGASEEGSRISNLGVRSVLFHWTNDKSALNNTESYLRETLAKNALVASDSLFATRSAQAKEVLVLVRIKPNQEFVYAPDAGGQKSVEGSPSVMSAAKDRTRVSGFFYRMKSAQSKAVWLLNVRSFDALDPEMKAVSVRTGKAFDEDRGSQHKSMPIILDDVKSNTYAPQASVGNAQTSNGTLAEFVAKWADQIYFIEELLSADKAFVDAGGKVNKNAIISAIGSEIASGVKAVSAGMESLPLVLKNLCRDDMDRCARTALAPVQSVQPANLADSVTLLKAFGYLAKDFSTVAVAVAQTNAQSNAQTNAQSNAQPGERLLEALTQGFAARAGSLAHLQELHDGLQKFKRDVQKSGFDAWQVDHSTK